ncbi:MAG: 30S ribosomal protein S20 [bacterium]|nr:30S ribosomal protein S20 [bacterium]
MANKKAAIKDIDRNKRNKARNVNYKSRLKTFLKKANTAVAENSDNTESLIKETLKIIDKTAAKGIIHKKTAARNKSRLTKAFNKTIAK